MEQLNIEGKRSGDGFVSNKALLVEALGRALAERISLASVIVGRKGLLAYLKALAGNMVKLTPSNGGKSKASDKAVKVLCGATSSTIADGSWIGEKTGVTLCEVRVSPHIVVVPNIGTSELAEALKRVVPFVAKEDDRPVLTCVNFEAGGGKLTLVSADGFRMAICQLDYEGEGKALVSGADLRGLIATLRKAQRVRLSFEGSKEKLDSQDLVIETERIAYRFPSYSGSFPEWQKLIPSECSTVAHFDASDAIRAVATLKAQSTDKEGYPIDLAVSEGRINLASPDGIGETTLTAETEGETTTRIDGKYLSECLRACGGMVKVELQSADTPSLFSANGYRMVVMPMLVQKEKPAKEKPAEAEAKAPAEAKAEASQPKETKAKKEPVAVK